MTPTILHITNGDLSTKKLKEYNIEGHIITWREMLCEGKTTSDVGSESFWKSRFDFFSKNSSRVYSPNIPKYQTLSISLSEH